MMKQKLKWHNLGDIDFYFQFEVLKSKEIIGMLLLREDGYPKNKNEYMLQVSRT